MRLKNKHVLVMGLGESGLAMAQWCVRQGARVRVADTRLAPPCLAALREDVPEAIFVAGEFDKRLLQGIDLVALSPGLSPGSLTLIHARAQGISVVGEIELFAWALEDMSLRDSYRSIGMKPTRVLAISGTNGKTTTTALTGHLINSLGKRAAVAGNISPAALNALMRAMDSGEMPDVWVLELSSFQLETLSSLNPDAATVLNISDDHLDRYIDLDDYAQAKARIFQGRGVQVLNRDDDRVKAMALLDRRLISFGLDAPGSEEDFGLRQKAGVSWIVRGEAFLLPIDELAIPGLHNAANAMAALALCAAIGLDVYALLPGLKSFRGLPHRVEKVLEYQGISWIDDSKGTNVGATLAALEGIGGQLRATTAAARIVLIAGGDGKGQDFSPLRQAVDDYARAVILLGRDAPAMAAVLAGSVVPVIVVADMAAAVAAAAEHACNGDVVLLSPACASLDMYRNYAHRAEVFIHALKQLTDSLP